MLRTLQPRNLQFADATRAITSLTAQGTRLHIVPQNLVELWVVATRPVEQNGLGMRSLQVEVELRKLKESFYFLPDTPEIYPAWEKLVIVHQVLGKPAHDARLAAALLTHGLTSILTFDKSGFSRFGIEVVHPTEVP